MTTADTQTPNKLTADAIDDLIYACRTNDMDWLREEIPAWAGQLHLTEGEVIETAIDVDEEGLGSRACLLHYPAANGNLEMVKYLLEKLNVSSGAVQMNGDAGNLSTSTSQSTSSRMRNVNLVNHKNVSGNTPLHWAALNGHLEVVKMLVAAGADPTIVNEAGRDAVVEAEYSSVSSAADCATWLLKECEVLERGAAGGQAGEGQVSAEDQEEMDKNRAESTNNINGDTNG